MLESRVLLVRPMFASTADRSSGRVADIWDALTGNLLGSAQRRASEDWWRGWLRPPALTVHEADDEPLLFILQRRWYFSGFWNVLDADEQPVGWLRPSLHDSPLSGRLAWRGGLSILDRDGRCLGTLQMQTGVAEEGSLLDPQGAKLATFRARAGETELAFHLAADSEPFLRMLLLAVVLQPLAA